VRNAGRRTARRELRADRAGAIAAGEELLSVLDRLVCARVQEALDRARGDAVDSLIRSDRLGPNNRIVRGLIERGELAAVKIGTRWHVRRSEWERYTRELEERQRQVAPPEAPTSDSGAVDDVDSVLRELGCERISTPHRRAGAGR
jgi:hypothetical protein